MKNCATETTKNNSLASHWYDGIYDSIDQVTDFIGGQSRSILLTMVDLLPIKPDSPFSTALLKHYVERSGGQLNLNEVAPIPQSWRDFIVTETRGQIGNHNLNPYNSGLFDLRNSLGHFDVKVRKATNNQHYYDISDFYAFGFFENDRAQQGRHGFPLGNDLPEDQLSILRAILPNESYCNPGGFSEKWEISQSGSETILYIPQGYLSEIGKPYQIIGSFTQ